RRREGSQARPRKDGRPSFRIRMRGRGRRMRCNLLTRRRHLAAPLMLATALALVFPAQALAQAPLPPTREDLSIGRDERRDARTSRLSIEGDIERGPCPLSDPSFADTRVTFSAVEFAGLPGVPAEALAHAWRDVAGRDPP